MFQPSRGTRKTASKPVLCACPRGVKGQCRARPLRDGGNNGQIQPLPGAALSRQKRSVRHVSRSAGTDGLSSDTDNCPPASNLT